MPVAVTSEGNVSRKSKQACFQALTLTARLLKYGVHDRNSLTIMQTIHAITHTYMVYSITVFSQNQENGLEKYNRSNGEPQRGSRFVFVVPHLRSAPLKWQLAIPTH